MQQVKSTPLYYGKSPAWGDFLKTKGQSHVIRGIDQWIQEALELAMENPSFDENYQALPALDLLIGNPQEPIFLVANLIASIDRAGRKFPMLLGHLIEVSTPLQHLGLAPFIYKPLLIELYKRNRTIRGTQNAAQLQLELAKLLPDSVVQSRAEHREFFQQYQFDSLAQLMAMSVAQLVRAIIQLGILLQPLHAINAPPLQQALLLPIHNVNYCYEISTFWVSLVCAFLAHQNLEVLIGILHLSSPVLVLSFQGADTQVLSDIINQALHTEHWIALTEAHALEQSAVQKKRLAELEQILCRSNLTLTQTISQVQHCFIKGGL